MLFEEPFSPRDCLSDRDHPLPSEILSIYEQDNSFDFIINNPIIEHDEREILENQSIETERKRDTKSDAKF